MLLKWCQYDINRDFPLSGQRNWSWASGCVAALTYQTSCQDEKQEVPRLSCTGEVSSVAWTWGFLIDSFHRFSTGLLLCWASFTACYSLEMPITNQEAWAHTGIHCNNHQQEKQMCAPLQLAGRRVIWVFFSQSYYETYEVRLASWKLKK